LGCVKKMHSSVSPEEDTPMRILIITLAIGFLAFLCLSCGEKSTDPDSQSSISFSSRYSKCLSSGLLKSSRLDSVFTYSFTDSLVIDFSVNANCCPDSNRFAVTESAGTDTLVISVADTAGNLCYCICTYMVHTSFENLPNDHYVVRCRVGNSQGYEDIHLVNVFRKR
jgi:hypothetical protein